MLNLNYSTGNTSDDFSLFDWVSALYKLSPNSIELGFNRARRIPTELSDDLIGIMQKFENVYMHAPVKLDNEWCSYPSNKMDKYIDRILNLMDRVEIKSVLFHPDLVKDFNYLNKLFGKKLSFENMDVKKEFGTTIQDMEAVFNKSPQARWICDLNHLYTLDETLNNTTKWHEVFGDRLVYYHLSAFGGFHSLFVDTHEDVILKGLLDTSKPVIHEGFSNPDAIDKLPSEKRYIEDFFQQQRKAE